MKKGEEISEKKGDFIKWFSEISKDSVPLVGGKGANLGEIFNLKVPVPPGFVVTTEAYKYFMKDLNDFAGMNEVYAKHFKAETAPARSTLQVARIPKDSLVEIEVVAYIGN